MGMSLKFLTGKVFIWVSSILALSVVGTGALIGYVYFDLFKSPKALFFHSEYRTFRQWSQSEFIRNNLVARTDTPASSVSHYRFELSKLQVGANNGGLGIAEMLRWLEDSLLRVEVQVDGQAGIFYNQTELTLANQEKLNMELFMDDTIVGLRVPEWYRKYVYIDMNEADEAMVGGPILQYVPDRMITQDDVQEAVEVPADERLSMLLDYGFFLYRQLENDQFELKRASTFRDREFSIATRQITLTFTEEQAKRLFANFADKFVHDENMIDRLYPRYVKSVEMLQDVGMEMKQSDRATFTADLQQRAAEWVTRLEGLTFHEPLKFVYEIDEQGVIVSRTMTGDWSLSGGERIQTSAAATHWEDALAGIGVTLSLNQRAWEGDEMKFSAMLRNQTANGTDTGNILLEMVTGQRGNDAKGWRASTRYEYDERIRRGDVQVQMAMLDSTWQKVSFQLMHQRLSSKQVTLPVLADNNSVDLADLSFQDTFELLGAGARALDITFR